LGDASGPRFRGFAVQPIFVVWPLAGFNRYRKGRVMITILVIYLVVAALIAAVFGGEADRGDTEMLIFGLLVAALWPIGMPMIVASNLMASAAAKRGDA
jgi:hypothetical protein